MRYLIGNALIVALGVLWYVLEPEYPSFTGERTTKTNIVYLSNCDSTECISTKDVNNTAHTSDGLGLCGENATHRLFKLGRWSKGVRITMYDVSNSGDIYCLGEDYGPYDVVLPNRDEDSAKPYLSIENNTVKIVYVRVTDAFLEYQATYWFEEMFWYALCFICLGGVIVTIFCTFRPMIEKFIPQE